MNAGDIAYVHDSTGDYVQNLGSYSGGSTVDDQQVTWTLGSAVGNQYRYIVEVPMVNYDQFDFGTDRGAEFTMLYARGAGNFAYHSERGFTTGLTQEDIEAGTAEAGVGTIEPTGSQKAHAWCMGLAWGVCAPLAILSARLKQCVPGLLTEVGGMQFWFQVHRICNYTTVILTVIGFIIALTMVEVDHFSFSHAQIGLVVTIFAFLQPFIAYVRPHKGEENRTVWEVVHISVGVTCMILGLANVMGGIDEIERFGFDSSSADSLQTVTLVWMLVVIVVYAISRLYTTYVQCTTEESTEGGSKIEEQDIEITGDETSTKRMPGEN